MTNDADMLPVVVVARRMEQKVSQQRMQWRKLCEGAGVDRDAQFTRDGSLSSEQFCVGLRALGTPKQQALHRPLHPRLWLCTFIVDPRRYCRRSSQFLAADLFHFSSSPPLSSIRILLLLLLLLQLMLLLLLLLQIYLESIRSI
eukprot:COSAG05_NODE_871_length_6848_cov_2.508372_3_plen_144_part_00